MFRRILRLATSVAMLCLVACSDDNPLGGSVSPESSGTPVVSGESSSSVAGTSSDDVGGSAANVASSSENVTMSSSSVTANSSSSAKAPKNTAACLWNASKGDYLVNTGFDPDSLHYAGFWYNFSDDPDGGVTEIHMPNVTEAYDGDEYEGMVALLEFCGSYCAEFIFRKGTSAEIFGGMGFNVAGIEEPKVSYVLRDGDISDWGGICVTYAADGDVLLRLYTDDDTFYQAEFGKSTEFVEKCVTWDALNAAEASKHASSIRFVMPGADSTKGHLSIAAIGKYDANGACEVDGYAYVLPKGSGDEGFIVLRSSSSGQSASSSSSPRGDCTEPKEVSEMWNGFALPLTYVETGLDNGTETSGYWFSFGDEESGNGKVVYPSTSGIDYTTTDQVFDYCMGVCGSLEFSKEGYLGVGFHVAGVVDPMDDNSLVAKANISSWGGLCVTYASESDLEVVLTYAQTSGFGDFSRMPKTTLPKSIELKTVCLDWKNYFMSGFSEVSTTFMTSILFAVQGEANTKSRINIRGLGKYSEKTNFCSPGEDVFVSGKLGLVIK
ncbi:MAG: hypothetical protein IKH55_06280 [Fibrobacter sp.]|nr:hypothetical protein [Fibrobacter sp.]